MVKVKIVNLRVGKVERQEQVLNDELSSIKGNVKDVKFAQYGEGLLSMAMILYEEA